MDAVEINPNRLAHLLTLYRMSKDELLDRLNTGRKKPLALDEIFGPTIKFSILKKIDSIFCKGVSYYVDPKDLGNSPGESIFFRKERFNADLSLGAKQIVNRFEQEKLEVSSLAKLSDFKFERKLPKIQRDENAREVAIRMREIVGLPVANQKREFLKAMIERLADFNVLVFEFIETHNKREKANIDGFYLFPNVIVLKRNQRALKREIFTLLHELGHYLLNEEEIDNVWDDNFGWSQLAPTERWCSDFAFYFLLGDHERLFASLPKANGENNFNKEKIDEIASATFLSSLALYTRLKISGRLSGPDYERIKKTILDSIDERQRQEREEAERKKQEAAARGIKLIASVPKPIVSPLYLTTLRSALYNGFINEVQFCKKLNIKPDKIEKFLL